jgi:Domain of unknown function (DUF4279)
MKADIIELRENPNCELTNATFRLMGDLIQPNELTILLGIQPNFSHAKGDTFESRAGLLKHRTGIWALESENKLEATNLEKHLIFLLDKLEPVSANILELITKYSLSVDFHCYWVSATGQGGPLISPKTLMRIANLHAYLDFEIQFFGVDESKDASS